MGLIEGILGKIRHFIIDFICHLLRNTIRNTPWYMLCFIPIYKVLAFLLHDSCLLL